MQNITVLGGLEEKEGMCEYDMKYITNAVHIQYIIENRQLKRSLNTAKRFVENQSELHS